MRKQFGLTLVFVGMILVLVFSGTGNAAEGIITVRDNFVSVNASKTKLGDILDAFHREFGIVFSGLEGREDEEVRFYGKGKSPEDVVKRLLKKLDEDNFVFEFNSVRLVKVSVMPKASASTGFVPPNPGEKPKIPPPPMHSMEKRKNMKTMVQVRSVSKGSQAEEAGIQRGDRIVDYDGVEITNTQQLIMEVKRKEKQDQVSITIERDGETIPMTLKGGYIGVRITTQPVPGEEDPNPTE